MKSLKSPILAAAAAALGLAAGVVVGRWSSLGPEPTPEAHADATSCTLVLDCDPTLSAPWRAERSYDAETGLRVAVHYREAKQARVVREGVLDLLDAEAARAARPSDGGTRQ